MATRLPDPFMVPNHDEAMAGAGREVQVDTPTNTYGTEVVDTNVGAIEATWNEPGYRPVRNPR